MFKRTSVAVMIVAAIFCLVVGNASARTPDDFGNGDGRSEKIYRHDFPKPIAPQPTPSKDTDSPNDNWLIYWYVCGSDIETGHNGNATRNIRELERLKNLPDNVTVLVQTGGATDWHHDKFKGKKMGRYLYDANGWKDLKVVNYPEDGTIDPNINMGAPETLKDFLKFGKKLEGDLYPDGNVHKVFVFWDHGGGSLGGVCSDNVCKGDMLSLSEIRTTFAEVYPSVDEPPFELIGFDACLMSTYETAVALKTFAKYMVGSQEVEYTYVMWDYENWIDALAKNPAMSGAQLGQVICDTYMKHCEDNFKAVKGIDYPTLATLSVIDLSKMSKLETAYNDFCQAALDYIDENNPRAFFSSFGRAAWKAESYRPTGNYMVDLKDLAIQSRRFIPALSDASNELIRAIDGLQGGSVISNVRGKYRNRGGGLSVYYPYSLNDYNNQSASIKDFSPAKRTELYDKFNGQFADLAKSLESEQPTEKEKEKQQYKPTPEFESLKDLPTDFDAETQRAFVQLTDEQLNSVYNVHVILLSHVKIEDETVLASMGIADDWMTENWAERKFEVSFKGEWFLFEGEGLYTDNFFDATERDENGNIIGGFILYSSPIFLNDERHKLIFACEYPKKTYSIIGAVKTSSDASLPDNEIVGLKKGDKVRPIYSIYPLPKDLPQEFSFGDYEREVALPKEIVLGKHSRIKKKILTGDVFKAYLGFFIFQNEFGDFERSSGFSFYMKDGKWKAETSR